MDHLLHRPSLSPLHHCSSPATARRCLSSSTQDAVEPSLPCPSPSLHATMPPLMPLAILLDTPILAMVQAAAISSASSFPSPPSPLLYPKISLSAAILCSSPSYVAASFILHCRCHEQPIPPTSLLALASHTTSIALPTINPAVRHRHCHYRDIAAFEPTFLSSLIWPPTAISYHHHSLFAISLLPPSSAHYHQQSHHHYRPDPSLAPPLSPSQPPLPLTATICSLLSTTVPSTFVLLISSLLANCFFPSSWPPQSSQFILPIITTTASLS